MLPYLTMATQLAHMTKIYNCKVIEYSNGITEIRKYNKPINSQYLNMTSEEVTKRQTVGKKIFSDVCAPDVLENPFTGELDDVYTDGQLKLLKQRAERSKKNSYSRTVGEIYKISRQCNWEYFITLTFDGAKVDRFDFDICMKKANKWFYNQRSRKAPDLQYMFVPEQHKDGAWHIHGLLAQVGNMSFLDSGKKVKGKTIYNLDGWKLGFSTGTKVDDTKRVSTYITKYITKDLCEVTKGKKRYYRSQNIPEPKESCLVLENDNDVQIIADSLGIELDYEKTVRGYLEVNYKYYKEIEEREEKEDEM